MIISLNKFKNTNTGGSGGNTGGGTVIIPPIEIPEIPITPYDGNVDVAGLRAIGWSEEDIQYLQDNVFWYKENDSMYKIPQDEIDLYVSEGSSPDNYTTWMNTYRITPPLFINLDINMSSGITLGTNVKSEIIPVVEIHKVYESTSSNCTITFTGDLFKHIGRIIVDYPYLNLFKLLVCKRLLNVQSIYFVDDNFPKYCGDFLRDCTSLRNFPTTNLDFNKYTQLYYTFANSTSIQEIPEFDCSNVTDCIGLFLGCSSLQTIPQLDTSNVTKMENMIRDCSSLQTIPQLDTSNVTNMKYMFEGCTSLQTIPQLDTSNVMNMNNMFEGCTSLQTIPQLDTSNVTSMYSMFQGCSSLQTIPQLNTSNVTDMGSMFIGCLSLQTIPQLNTSNVTTMGYMFKECSLLKHLPQLDTSNVTNMGSMLNKCTSLQTIPQLDTSNVTNMNAMFQSCSSLKYLPQLDTSNVTDMGYMFNNCINLTFVEGIDFSSLTSSPSSFTGYTSFNYLRRFIVNGKIDFSWTSQGPTNFPNIDYESIRSILTAMSNTSNTNAKTMAFSHTLTDRGTELRELVSVCASKGWTITGLTIDGIEYTPGEDGQDDLLLISVIDANTNEKVGEFTQTVTSVANVYSYPFTNVTGDFYFVDAQGNYYANPVKTADEIYGKGSATATVSGGVSYYLNKSQQVIHVDTVSKYVVHICLDDETIRWNGNTTAIPTGTPTK